MVSLAFHLVFHKIYEIELSEVLATKMSVMRRSIKVSSFELYTVDPFSPHSIKVSSFELYTFDPFSPHSIKVSSFELYTFDPFSPHSIKVSSFELYTFDPFSPHSGSIPRELVHSYVWVACELLQFVVNTVGRHG